MAIVRYVGGAGSYGLELGELSKVYHFNLANRYRVELAEEDREWFVTAPPGDAANFELIEDEDA